MSQYASLFHGTKTTSLKRILDLNIMYGSVQERGALIYKEGIFLTRSLKHAQNIYGAEDTVIIEFSQEKLKQRYKIRPVRNWFNRDVNYKPLYDAHSLGGNEFEEFLYTDKIEFIEDYIIKIHGNNS